MGVSIVCETAAGDARIHTGSGAILKGCLLCGGKGDTQEPRVAVRGEADLEPWAASIDVRSARS